MAEVTITCDEVDEVEEQFSVGGQGGPTHERDGCTMVELEHTGCDRVEYLVEVKCKQ